MAKVKTAIKEVPKIGKFTNYLLKDNKEKSFSLDCKSFYDKYKFSKTDRVSFELTPITREERDKVTENYNLAGVRAMVWCCDNLGYNEKDIANINKDIIKKVTLEQASESFIDKGLQNEILSKHIVGWSAKEDFPKNENGTMRKEVFEKLPDELKELLFDNLQQKSELSFMDNLGL